MNKVRSYLRAVSLAAEQLEALHVENRRLRIDITRLRDELRTAQGEALEHTYVCKQGVRS